MKTYEKYLNEGMTGKPKKGDMIMTIAGQELKIAIVSRGIVYANVPGEIERFVVGLADVKPAPAGTRKWVETIGGKSFYDYK